MKKAIKILIWIGILSIIGFYIGMRIYINNGNDLLAQLSITAIIVIIGLLMYESNQQNNQ